VRFFLFLYLSEQGEKMKKQVLTRRQFIQLSTLSAGAALLAACTSPATPAPTAVPTKASVATQTSAAPANVSPTKVAEPTKPAATNTAPAVVKEPGSKVKITYWGSFTGKNGETEKALVDKFNSSQSDITLDYQFQGSYEDTAQKLTAAVQSKTTPEVSLLSDVWWFKFYLAKTLAPLDDLMTKAKIDKTDYVDVLLSEGIRKNVHYWVPMARSTPLFYYNKDHWKAAGLPDRGPETWDEMMEWAPKLLKKEGNQIKVGAFGHPGAASYIAWLFQGVTWQFEGMYSKPDFTMTMTNEKTIEAGVFYGDTVNKYGWATFPKDIQVDFVSGLVSSAMLSTGSMGGVLANAKFPVGTAFLPKKKLFGCCTGGAGLAILAAAPKEKQEAAMKWIDFATNTVNTTFWAKNTGYMPVRKSAVKSDEMQAYFKENPTFKTAVDQLPLTRPQDAARVFVPNGDQIIGKGLERIIVNKEAPKDVFAAVNKELETAAAPVVASLKAVEG
jgi:sn-glycerol 3-phosphate transport system substrate-binding protein